MTSKKIAIFCDGTWNDLRSAHATNVARLAKCVAPFNADTGAQQIVYYDEGVGVSSNISRTTDELVKLSGGAFGRGLDRKIEAAYRFLVLNHEPGDEIFVFGFSRGAYTARSLCGLIRKCGIVRRDCFDQVPKAMELYRNGLHPKDVKLAEFRENYSHRLSAGAEDSSWVEARLKAKVNEFPQANRFAWLAQHRPSYSYRLMYLGLWDTVGSMGVPPRFWFLNWLNNKYRFHDTNASSLIASIRHAVALEEDRRVFASTPVQNIGELNAEWSSANAKRGESWDVIDTKAPNFVPYNHRPYQQMWFPGGHGAVGGGNAEPGLPNATLLWVAEGACLAGLSFVEDPRSALMQAVGAVNPLADWRIDKKGRPQGKDAFDLLGFIGGRKRRRGPEAPDEIGMTARVRWRANNRWRPKNLKVIRLLMGKMLAAAPPPPAGMFDAPKGCPPTPSINGVTDD